VPETLPLFPLGSVLFPGLMLPLHVFEQRYRTLVRDLMALPEGAPRRFGVVAIRSGREVGPDGARALHEVGCAAEVSEVAPHDDGRFDVATVGTERFRLHGLAETPDPYLVGDVEWLPEEVGDAGEAEVLTASVSEVFSAYLRTLAAARRSRIEVPTLPDDPLVLSYLVAATTVVDLEDTQSLLAAPDGVTRLRAELALLKREATMLRRLTAAPAPELARTPVSPN
jgi:uncharacterized protein